MIIRKNFIVQQEYILLHACPWKLPPGDKHKSAQQFISKLPAASPGDMAEMPSAHPLKHQQQQKMPNAFYRDISATLDRVSDDDRAAPVGIIVQEHFSCARAKGIACAPVELVVAARAHDNTAATS